MDAFKGLGPDLELREGGGKNAAGGQGMELCLAREGLRREKFQVPSWKNNRQQLLSILGQ